MLRKLSLLASLAAAAAQTDRQSCSGSASISVSICDDVIPGKDTTTADATSLNPPAWNCGATSLNVGEVAPMLIEMVNACRNTELGPTAYVTAKIRAGASITVIFACRDDSCAGDALLSGVITYAGGPNAYSPTAQGTTITADAGANQAVINIGEDIDLPIDVPERSTEIGIIFTRATAFPVPANQVLVTKAQSTTAAVVVTDPNCLDASASAAGTTTSAFLVSPPPPPPPPDCCTKANRQCLARCGQCHGANKVSVDKTGETCSGYCATTCASYPTDASEKCFEDCLECSKEPAGTNDIQGEPCTGTCDTNCETYYKCIRAETCALGCAEGRRERKLLFAAIPPCVPCCKPMM